MKKIAFFIIIFQLLCVTVFTQNHPKNNEQSKSERLFGPPIFLYDTYFFISSNDRAMTRVELYIGFCNDILQFVKKIIMFFLI